MVRALTLLDAGYYPAGLLDDFDGLAGDRWEPWSADELVGWFVAPMDIRHEADAIVLKAEVPGIKKEDVEITLQGDVLTVKAEKKVGKAGAEEIEKSYARSVTLPFEADSGKIEAYLEDGILEIRVPKPAEVMPTKIGIRARAAQVESPKPAA